MKLVTYCTCVMQFKDERFVMISPWLFNQQSILCCTAEGWSSLLQQTPWSLVETS